MSSSNETSNKISLNGEIPNISNILNDEKPNYLEKCPICCGKINSMYQLPCRHIFHMNCIDDWLRRDENSKRCSSCNDTFDKDEFKTIIKQIKENKKLKLKRKRKEEETTREKF